MKVKELIEELQKLDPEKMVVVQKNFPEGFMLCSLVLQGEGHIGFDGPIVHLGEQICFDNETKLEDAR